MKFENQILNEDWNMVILWKWMVILRHRAFAVSSSEHGAKIIMV